MIGDAVGLVLVLIREDQEQIVHDASNWTDVLYQGGPVKVLADQNRDNSDLLDDGLLVAPLVTSVAASQRDLLPDSIDAVLGVHAILVPTQLLSGQPVQVDCSLPFAFHLPA